MLYCLAFTTEAPILTFQRFQKQFNADYDVTAALKTCSDHSKKKNYACIKFLQGVVLPCVKWVAVNDVMFGKQENLVIAL